MTPYPLSLPLAGRRVVLVGGGTAAARRLPGFLAAGARVSLVAAELTPAVHAYVDAGRVAWQARDFAEVDLDDAWLVCLADPAAADTVLAAAERRRVFCVPAEDQAPDNRAATTGSVALVGSGPGDPELITVKGRRLLAEADVVVADRLVPGMLLDALRPGVELVDASKIPYGPSVAQEEINRVLVDRALAGRSVVRLKGGDPFVFGRGGEEVIACVAAGVPVIVVPGVTSSVAAPALAGIPVTHRGVAHGFTVVSGHLPPGHPESLVDWGALARLGGTLVVLMGLKNLAKITTALVEHGLDPTAPVGVVQEGSTDRQRALRSTVGEVAADVAADGIRPPAVVVIGPVVDALGSARR
ncbi:uroporphyrinogen-III C-methyltransferase [Pilimelia columellifera]|uniref:uroporphyrinogen-III C-methyltransferase n=1 Tax=Pilimelia columellifera subsp. columellifera TaxID=706583 RepID=A0ABN3NRQ8_9ACTN